MIENLTYEQLCFAYRNLKDQEAKSILEPREANLLTIIEKEIVKRTQAQLMPA